MEDRKHLFSPSFVAEVSPILYTAYFSDRSCNHGNEWPGVSRLCQVPKQATRLDAHYDRFAFYS